MQLLAAGRDGGEIATSDRAEPETASAAVAHNAAVQLTLLSATLLYTGGHNRTGRVLM